VVEAHLPVASHGLGLENTSRAPALMLADPEHVALLSDNLMLLVAVCSAKCPVDEDYRVLHVRNVDTVLRAHDRPGQQLDFLLHHFVFDGVLDGYGDGFEIVLRDVLDKVIVGAGFPRLDRGFLVTGSGHHYHRRILRRLKNVEGRAVSQGMVGYDDVEFAAAQNAPAFSNRTHDCAIVWNRVLVDKTFESHLVELVVFDE